MSQLFSSIGGGELFDRVIEDEFVLTERACVCFMKQILEGVSYMHHQQVIHLDLKVSEVCNLVLQHHPIAVKISLDTWLLSPNL